MPYPSLPAAIIEVDEIQSSIDNVITSRARARAGINDLRCVLLDKQYAPSSSNSQKQSSFVEVLLLKKKQLNLYTTNTGSY